MAGYFEFSKSNNAIAAEEDGRYPATQLAKRLGVTTQAIKATLEPCEWHHTSKMYNKTDYYDMEEAIDRIDELKAFRPAKASEIVHENCTVHFVEWSGTQRRPKATEHTLKSVKVVEKGSFLTFEFQGKPKKKKKGANGFYAFCNGRTISNE